MTFITFVTFYFPVQNGPHGPLIKAVFSAKKGKIFPINYISFWRNYNKWFALLGGSSFIGAISHIVRLRPEKKVFWSNAARVITFMANIKAFIKRTVSKLVNNSGCGRSFSSVFSAEHNNTVTTRLFSSCPKPASFCFVDFIPYTLGQRFAFHALHNNWLCWQSQSLKMEGARA